MQDLHSYPSVIRIERFITVLDEKFFEFELEKEAFADGNMIGLVIYGREYLEEIQRYGDRR